MSKKNENEDKEMVITIIGLSIMLISLGFFLRGFINNHSCTIQANYLIKEIDSIGTTDIIQILE